jgi:hypothetical protein
MAIYTLRSGATALPEDSVLQPFTDLIKAGGVVDLSDEDHLKVVERGAGANMSVDISAGRGVIKGSGNAYPVRNTTAINAAIGSNAAGNPRKDAIVLYIDLAESPTATADDVVKSAVVAGTAAASPVAPSDSTIQAAVGGSNPFLRLANVNVANGETAIEDAHIEDARAQFKTRHMINATTTTYGANVTIDAGEFNDQIITLTGNLEIDDIINFTVDVPIILRFVQGGSGSYDVDWSNLDVDWYDGEPALTPTVAYKDAILLIPRSNGRFEGFTLGQSANIT